MIFQDPLTSLNPVYTIGYQIAEAVLAHNDVSKQQGASSRAVELLSIVGIPFPEQRVDSYPHELSGGMRQRVVIAIAMANDPDVIIADEPTTALDVTVQAQVLEALEAARDETGAALILITHDLGVIAGHAERICVMYAGKLVETGTDRGRLLPAAHAVHARPARQPAAPGPGAARAAHPDQGLAAVAAEPAARLPVHARAARCAEDICDSEEPDCSAGRRHAAHAAACHFRDRAANAEAARPVRQTGDELLARPTPRTSRRWPSS